MEYEINEAEEHEKQQTWLAIRRRREIERALASSSARSSRCAPAKASQRFSKAPLTKRVLAASSDDHRALTEPWEGALLCSEALDEDDSWRQLGDDHGYQYDQLWPVDGELDAEGLIFHMENSMPPPASTDEDGVLCSEASCSRELPRPSPCMLARLELTRKRPHEGRRHATHHRGVTRMQRGKRLQALAEGAHATAPVDPAGGDGGRRS